MTDSDVKSIIADLDRWAAGELGAKLTWGVLEERFSFSRQSLQAKPEIKAAYDYAKKALSGGLVKTREQANKDLEQLQHENERLKLELAEYKRKEALWLERWQRIAYNIRQKGLQVHQIDSQTPESNAALNQKDIAKVLRPFETEVPASGRI